MNEYEQILNELYKFDNSILELGSEISDNRLEKFELQIQFTLPNTFKTLISKHNSFSLMGTVVYGIGEEFRGISFDKVYDFEHFQIGNPMPKELFPFSPDGRGNHYCLDLSEPENSKVVFWQHDVNYVTKNEIEVCNDSFCSWIKEVMIDWTLKNYNYDGTDKY